MASVPHIGTIAAAPGSPPRASVMRERHAAISRTMISESASTGSASSRDSPKMLQKRAKPAFQAPPSDSVRPSSISLTAKTSPPRAATLRIHQTIPMMMSPSVATMMTGSSLSRSAGRPRHRDPSRDVRLRSPSSSPASRSCSCLPPPPPAARTRDAREEPEHPQRAVAPRDRPCPLDDLSVAHQRLPSVVGRGDAVRAARAFALAGVGARAAPGPVAPDERPHRGLPYEHDSLKRQEQERGESSGPPERSAPGREDVAGGDDERHARAAARRRSRGPSDRPPTNAIAATSVIDA